MRAVLSRIDLAGGNRNSAAGTDLHQGRLRAGENRITPPGPQAPPRPNGASATTCAEPPLISIVFSLASAKNPSERLSGDQNGKIPPSVPGRMRASSELVGRIHSWVLPSDRSSQMQWKCRLATAPGARQNRPPD